ncbi:hypothetical protein [Rhodovulum sulfidophilum]|uniref:hypothetical protein n=1 Tax=Rhodovulum sulfidophilum TaxID=35806 RepID=UPI00117A0E19|nr:hypothetical protein [Rhodovulum sulfidophilum]MBL3554183.1 hypothetical protein [Rhodovulum sulfidophilum]
MKDVLRYTTIFPDRTHAEGVRATRAELSKQGFSEVKFKNTWGEVGYKGINAVYQTAEGFKFELQFHTSASYQAKETGTHELYEQQRVLEPGSKAWQKLEDAQNAVFDQIPVPHEARGLE